MIYTPQNLQKLIEKHIDDAHYGDSPKELYDPIRYIMHLGGKRLRPMMTVLTYLLYKDDPKQIINQAVAVELFHNFSLVHDDIMDNAPLRRSKPTVHEKWNTNIAILSGDVMLVKVYEFLLKGLPEDKIRKVLEMFNQAAIKVCEGQQFDMNFEKTMKVHVEEYIEMIRLKTAELLSLSMNLGAVMAGKDGDVKTLTEFGNCIGIGFQLKDDLLDAFGGEKFGKQVGGDIKSKKKTFLTLKAFELANKGHKHELKSLYSQESSLSGDERVACVLDIYEKYEIKRHTEDLIKLYFEKAFHQIKKIDAPLNRKALLKNYVELLIDRQS